MSKSPDDMDRYLRDATSSFRADTTARVPAVSREKIDADKNRLMAEIRALLDLIKEDMVSASAQAELETLIGNETGFLTFDAKQEDQNPIVTLFNKHNEDTTPQVLRLRMLVDNYKQLQGELK